MKLRVYVSSNDVPTTGFVDKEGAMHACAQAQKTAFQGLHDHAGLFGNRALTEEESKLVIRINEFCNENGLELEIIDLATLNILDKLKHRIKGIRNPATCYGERMFQGIPDNEDLKKLTES